MSPILLALAAGASSCALPPGAQWQFEQPSYASVGSKLELQQKSSQWKAALDGHPLETTVRDRSIQLKSGGEVRFTGTTRDGGIHGFWFEPKSPLDHARAFSMTLTRSAAGAWNGIVGAGEDPLRLNVWLLPGKDGRELLVRNPDGLVGDVRFAARGGGCELDLQDVNDAGHHSRLTVNADGGAILHSLDDELPSAGLAPASAATSPEALAGGRDDLPTGSPEAVGLDGRLLAALFQVVEQNDPRQRGTPLIHSILVARHGRLVAEHYFGGYSEGRLQDLRSLSKSFTPLLVGAAIEHDVKISGATPLERALPQYSEVLRADARKGQITLDELLAMRSGLACDDFDDNSPGGEDRMQEQSAEPDWYRYFLELPIVNVPGSHYAYCSAGTHVAAGMVASVAHRSALETFDEWIARPLGITAYSLPLDPLGRAYFGGGAHMRPRDVLKIGQLVLDHGKWNGRQIVEAAWLQRSISCPAADPDCPEGLGWHFNAIHANGRTYREVEANGNGGQLLMIYPELDLAIVITAANYNSYPVWRKFREELVPRYVLAALKDKGESSALTH